MRRWLLGLLALVVLAGGGVSAVHLREGLPAAEGLPEPAPVPSRTPLLSDLASAGTPTTAGLTRALRAALADRALGGRVSIAVVDGAGRTLLDVNGRRAVTPASTTKIATAVAALTVLDPDLQLRTTVVRGARPGEVVLVGGGDPTLAGRFPTSGYPGAATLATLAKGLTGVTRVLVDDSLYVGPRLARGWKPAYVTTGNVAPITALAVDEGRVAKRGARSQDPAIEAGRQLAALLRVKAPVARYKAPAGAQELASVQSPPVSALVEAMLSRSDNDLAEALGRQVALATKHPASFEGAAAGIRAALQRLAPAGIELHDASGLSRLNRIQPLALAQLVARVADDPSFGPLLTGLPVGGFDGTLAKRYRTGPASLVAGQVRAKTGTLDGVSALAGLVTTRTGGVLAFDVTADGVPFGSTLAAEAALDRVAAALVRCGCT